MRKLIYYVAVTADGFIADPDGDFSFFDNDPATLAEIFAEYPETCPTHLREALGVSAEPRHFDTVVMGRRTHQPALDAGLSSAYPHLRQVVVSHRTDLPSDDHVELVSSDPVGFVRGLKRGAGLDIWLCGGGHLAGQLAAEIDEFHLKINPVLLIGSGIPVVGGLNRPLALELRSSRALPNGVQLAIFGRA